MRSKLMNPNKRTSESRRDSVTARDIIRQMIREALNAQPGEFQATVEELARKHVVADTAEPAEPAEQTEAPAAALSTMFGPRILQMRTVEQMAGNVIDIRSRLRVRKITGQPRTVRQLHPAKVIDLTDYRTAKNPPDLTPSAS